MTTNTRLPKAVIEVERADLNWHAAKAAREAAMEAAGCAGWSLQRFRWHWTCNVDNPDRVTQKDYAALTGVSKQAVSESVRTYKAKQAEVAEKAAAKASDDDSEPESDGQALTEPVPEPVKLPTLTKQAEAVAQAVAALRMAVDHDGAPATKGYRHAIEDAVADLAHLAVEVGLSDLLTQAVAEFAPAA